MVSGTPGGLLHALGRVRARLLEGLIDRGELLSLELKEEKERFFALLLLGLLVALLAFMAFLLLNATIVAIAWEHRVVVLLAMFGFYLLLAVGIGLGLWYRMRHAPAPFAATMETLQKDRSTFFREE